MKFYIRTTNKQNCLSCTKQEPLTDLKYNCPPKFKQKPIPPSPPKAQLKNHHKPQIKVPPKTTHKRQKINFTCLKKDTIKSLNEVECFLCNFQNICKYIKLYKILR